MSSGAAKPVTDENLEVFGHSCPSIHPKLPAAVNRPAKISVETHSGLRTRWFLTRSQALEAQVHFLEAGDALCILLS
jgi:hypothetical protein